MNRVYITGDTHADFFRFIDWNGDYYDDEPLDKNDYVIICGDFGGVWKDSATERNALDWLNNRPYTILFVDGNHENFDRLNGKEFQVREFCGGLVHEIRPSVLHLMRGQIYNIAGKTFFMFGGAASHDIEDGIIDPLDFADEAELRECVNRMRYAYKRFRVKGRSWWPQELPSETEMEYGIKNLREHGNKVDYIITHCLPSSIICSFGHTDTDIATNYLQKVSDKVNFDKWFCGHYHMNKHNIFEKYNVLYEDIIRLL